MNLLEPTRFWLKGNDHISVAQACFGLTLYLEDHLDWAREHARGLLELYLERVDPNQLAWLTTSQLGRWQLITPNDLPHVVASISTPTLVDRVRHHFEVRLADDPGAPSMGFVYHEVEERREPRTSWAQLFFPMSTPADDVLAFAVEVSRRFPLVQMHGGYVITTHRDHALTGLSAAYGWCKRYWGMDVPYPDAMAFHARASLVAQAPILFVGELLAARLELTADRFAGMPHGIVARTRGRSLLVHAPIELGDMHAMTYPAALAALTQEIEPLFAEELPDLPGRFTEEKATKDWRRRFRVPEKWA